MKAAIYVRHYSRQETHDAQVAKLRQVADSRQLSISGEYTEKFGGLSRDSRQLRRLLSEIRAKRIDALLVVSLDRIARSKEDLYGLLREMAERGVRIISIRERFDSGGLLTTQSVLSGAVKEDLEKRIWKESQSSLLLHEIEELD